MQTDEVNYVNNTGNAAQNDQDIYQYDDDDYDDDDLSENSHPSDNDSGTGNNHGRSTGFDLNNNEDVHIRENSQHISFWCFGFLQEKKNTG